MSDTFRSQYVQITNETRPKLDLLNEKFFEVCERCENAKDANINRENFPKVKTTALASNIETNQSSKGPRQKMQISRNFVPCSLCTKDISKDADHPLHKCTKYQDANSRISKINRHHGCIKCGNLSHKTNNCNFKFKQRCSDWHFRFLCDKSNLNTKYEKPADQRKNQGNSEGVIRETFNLCNMTNSLQSRSIITTFSCKIGKDTVRCLKDSACQSNFITETCAKENKLKIVHENI